MHSCSVGTDMRSLPKYLCIYDGEMDVIFIVLYHVIIRLMSNRWKVKKQE